MPIHRFETLNEIQQAFESMAAVCGLEGIRRIRKILQFFQPDERLIPEAPLPQNMRSSDIVRHAIEPGAERASPIKSAEAPPQGDVNLLQQVAPQIGITLVSASQPLQRGSIRLNRLLIELVLPGPECRHRRNGLNCAHI